VYFCWEHGRKGNILKRLDRTLEWSKAYVQQRLAATHEQKVCEGLFGRESAGPRGGEGGAIVNGDVTCSMGNLILASVRKENQSSEGYLWTNEDLLKKKKQIGRIPPISQGVCSGHSR